MFTYVQALPEGGQMEPGVLTDMGPHPITKVILIYLINILD
jgi:hypothetical protein